MSPSMSAFEDIPDAVLAARVTAPDPSGHPTTRLPVRCGNWQTLRVASEFASPLSREAVDALYDVVIGAGVETMGVADLETKDVGAAL